MKKIIYFFALFAALISLAGCSKEYIRINDQKIEVEIADNSAETSIGLMYRESLGDGSGMLFVFDEETPKTFWMKNTLIPLDMIFINSNKEIVDITTMQPCKTQECERYTSKYPARYVLEVNAGFAEKDGIKIGDKVQI